MNKIRMCLSGLALLAGLTGCGTDDNSEGRAPVRLASCITGSLTGAGSSFVQNMVQQWSSDYVSGCDGATVSYTPVGSSAGIQQLSAGTVDFAGTDVPPSTRELDALRPRHGQVVVIPWTAGGIAVEYNLAGVDEIDLSPRVLAGIFAGTVTRWNDPALTVLNPDRRLPDRAIQVVHRSDGSGTTAAFTTYLDAVAGDVWTVGAGKDVDWPVGQGAKGSDGVTAAVKGTEGAISYAELSFAEANDLGVARVSNRAGAFVEPSPSAVRAALGASEIDDDGAVELDYLTDDPAAYPISAVTYAVVPPTLPSGRAELARSFLDYALTDGQQRAEPLSYAPLPQALLDRSRASARSIGVT